MDEKVIKKLDEQLNCVICLDTYTDPKLLQCFHIFCKKCLIKLVVRDPQGLFILACPTCRKITSIPPNGVRGLQSAFRINDLLEIRDVFKKSVATTNQETGLEVDARMQIPYCSEHVEEELKLYCHTCNKLICLACCIKGDKHHSHDYDRIHVAFEKYKGEVLSSLEPMENQLKTIHKALVQLNKRSGEISDQREIIEARIHSTVRRLHETLDVRKTELIGQLHQMTQRKLKGLASQRDEIETIQARINNSLEYINGSLNTNESEVLKMKATIIKQVKELSTPLQPDILKPNTEADITFSASLNIFEQYGKISTLESPDPSKCYAAGKGLEVSMVRGKSSVILQAINGYGDPCEKPIESLQCQLVSEITNVTTCGREVERRGKSQYQIRYQPTIKGAHQLHIKVQDQHIKGSPFPVVVKLPVEKLGIPILSIDGMKRPWGIASNQKGDVVVSEEGGHCISIFSANGQKITSFGTYGSDHGQFNSPCGVAVDGEGNILVVDSLNHRIQKFTAKGQFFTFVGSKGNGPLQFNSPQCIAYNSSNDKVYVGNDKHRVIILNSDFTFSGSFGKQGSGKGHFNELCGIVCDSNGKVYVADSENHRIQIFTAEGKFLRMFGKRGHRKGELYRPISIAIDTSDRVYIGDCNDRVSVFTSDGHFIKLFGQEGEEPGEFNCVCGLAVHANGVVYVCDYYNNRIQIF